MQNRRLRLFFFHILLLYTCISANGQINILEQKVSITFKNLSIKQALKQLSNETGYYINFASSKADPKRVINASYSEIRLADIIIDLWGSDTIKLEAFDDTVDILFSRAIKKQNNDLTGTIKDVDDKPIPGATIQLLGTNLGAIADPSGGFTIKDIPNGNYTLLISSFGFEKYQKNIQIEEKTNDLAITLRQSIGKLEEVIVYGKSIEREKMEQPIKVEAINTKVFRSQSISLPQIINQTSGVRVRQAGGIGSATTININGLQGTAIRFFKDNIPLDYLGSAFNLSILPIDQLSNVEIYKGVLPVILGADALGGAVNFLTRDNYQDYLDVSYGLGSFNTHQLNVNGHYQIPNSKFHVGITSYYLHSDNSFRNKAPITDLQTQTVTFQKVERFHDAVTSGYAELKFGLKDVRIADLIEIGGSFFDVEKELQNGLTLTNPYGEALSSERNYTGTLRLKKEIKGFKIDIFTAYGQRKVSLTDTTNRQYDWFGDFVTVPRSGGELSGNTKTLQELDFETMQGRLFISKDLNVNHQISLSHNLIFEERIGSNPLGERLPDGRDLLSIPSRYTRFVSGVGWNAKWLNGKLQHQVTFKHYGLQTEGIGRVLPVNPEDQLIRFLEINNSSFGGGTSFKYSVKKDLFFRLSYEYAIRIPESIEYFGDGLFTEPNVALEPETSHNLNGGFFYQFGKSGYSLDVNSYYRLVDDNIFLRVNVIGIGQYSNLENLRVRGLETALKGPITSDLNFSAAITWQDLRRRDLGGGSALEDSRLPNVPFFFTNVNLRYKKSNLLGLKGSWEFYGSHSFVEKFHRTGIPRAQEIPLFGELRGFTDLIIPSQHVVDIGATYKLPNSDFWVNIEVNNLLNNEVFDNFRVPRPGINYRLKLRYQLSGKTFNQ